MRYQFPTEFELSVLPVGMTTYYDLHHATNALCVYLPLDIAVRFQHQDESAVSAFLVISLDVQHNVCCPGGRILGGMNLYNVHITKRTENISKYTESYNFISVFHTV